jgi:hypothetical protein
MYIADFGPAGIKFLEASFDNVKKVQEALDKCSELPLLATGLFTRRWDKWYIIIYNIRQNIFSVSLACGPLAKKIAQDTSRLGGIMDGVMNAIQLLSESHIPTEQITDELGRWLPSIDAAGGHLKFHVDRLSGYISDELRRQQDAAVEGDGATDERMTLEG